MYYEIEIKTDNSTHNGLYHFHKLVQSENKDGQNKLRRVTNEELKQYFIADLFNPKLEFDAHHVYNYERGTLIVFIIE